MVRMLFIAGPLVCQAQFITRHGDWSRYFNIFFSALNVVFRESKSDLSATVQDCWCRWQWLHWQKNKFKTVGLMYSMTKSHNSIWHNLVLFMAFLFEILRLFTTWGPLENSVDSTKGGGRGNFKVSSLDCCRVELTELFSKTILCRNISLC